MTPEQIEDERDAAQALLESSPDAPAEIRDRLLFKVALCDLALKGLQAEDMRGAVPLPKLSDALRAIAKYQATDPTEEGVHSAILLSQAAHRIDTLERSLDRRDALLRRLMEGRPDGEDPSTFTDMQLRDYDLYIKLSEAFFPMRNALSSRPAIIEECARVAVEHGSLCSRIGDMGKARTAATIADLIRALAPGGQKGDKNG